MELFCREEEDGARRDIYGAFQGLPPHAATAGRLDHRHMELMASKFCVENSVFDTTIEHAFVPGHLSRQPLGPGQ